MVIRTAESGVLLATLLRYLIVIGIGRRSGPLLVGLATGALLVGVGALAQPAAVGPADPISAPAAAPTTTPAPAVPTVTTVAAAPATAAGGRPTAGRVGTGRSPGGGGAARTTAAAAPPASPSPRAGRTPAPAPAAVGGSQTAQVVALTNQARVRAGCAALHVDARLTAAAQGHSADMAANGYFDHDGLDGSSFADRIEARDYPSPGGENIAQGQRDAQAVVTAWLKSPRHRANIENCTFTTIGIGLAGADRYWTQDFGR